MIAIVLSGGGNRGPLEVGALQALFEHGIWPDMLVGTSAGAINSAFLAAAGTPDCIPQLAEAWHKGAREVVYPGSLLSMGLRVLSGADSLFPSDGMRRLVSENLPPGVNTFADLKIPCYLTAVDLQSSRLYLFGEDPQGPVVDAVVASCSIPAIHPPVDYHGLQLVDGGVVAATPASVAMEKGANVIYAINVGHGEESMEPAKGIFEIISRTLDTFILQSLLMDLRRAAADPAVELHHIHIPAFSGIAFNDFDHIDEMIVAGRQATEAYLAGPAPRVTVPPGSPARPAAPAANGGHRVPGAREYIPPYRR